MTTEAAISPQIGHGPATCMQHGIGRFVIFPSAQLLKLMGIVQ